MLFIYKTYILYYILYTYIKTVTYLAWSPKIHQPDIDVVS